MHNRADVCWYEIPKHLVSTRLKLILSRHDGLNWLHALFCSTRTRGKLEVVLLYRKHLLYYLHLLDAVFRMVIIQHHTIDATVYIRVHYVARNAISLINRRIRRYALKTQYRRDSAILKELSRFAATRNELALHSFGS